jgi:hypothetical protein
LAHNGIYFYKSAKQLPWCDTNGIIAKNDVVLIKVNAEWPERGMTNTDLIKGVIARIVAHPDTFTGEVQLVENGQWRHSWEYSQNNAENTAQTMMSVVELFANQGFRVGAYNWTAIGYGSNNRWVNEYDQGDTNSGYVREDSSGMTYPKFNSCFGTAISVRKGIWNGAQYESERLKFINMPVLKSHSIMGVTASVKHYIGFLSYAAIGSSQMYQSALNQGLLGVNFGKARFPNLNIIDATWVMAEIATGPNAPYDLSIRLNMLVASQDPIAADYYAGRYVIRPVSWWNGHPWLHDYGRMDPENLNSEVGTSGHYSDSTPSSGFQYNAFRQMLISNQDMMLAYGKQVTMDTSQMTVHIFSFRGQTGIDERQGFGPKHIIERLAVIPNPSDGNVKINYSLRKPGKVDITIHSLDGRQIHHFAVRTDTAGEHSLAWNLTNEAGQRVPNGSYLVTIESGAERLNYKFIINQ